MQRLDEITDGVVYALLFYIPELLFLVCARNQLRNKQ